MRKKKKKEETGLHTTCNKTRMYVCIYYVYLNTHTHTKGSTNFTKI